MTVHHFLFHAWPDHGVPEAEEDVTALKNLLETTSKLQQTEQCEVYVNCSAGIGRTGTFIALWSLLASPMRFAKPIGKGEPPSGIKPFPAWAKETTGQIDFIYRLTGTTPAQPWSMSGKLRMFGFSSSASTIPWPVVSINSIWCRLKQ
jgi:hypothetical protein